MLASYLLSRTLVPVAGAPADGRARRSRAGEATADAPSAGRPLQRLARPPLRALPRRLRGAARVVHRAPRASSCAGGRCSPRSSLLLVDGGRPRLLPRRRHRADAPARARAHRHAHRGHRARRQPRRGARSAASSRPTSSQTINDIIGVPTFYNLAFVSDRQRRRPGRRDPDRSSRPSTAPPQGYMARIRSELPAQVPRARRPTSMPADVVTQVLNFGVSSMIDVQIEGRDPRPSFAGRAPAARDGCARCPAPRTCASPRCSTTRRCGWTSTGSRPRSSTSP